MFCYVILCFSCRRTKCATTATSCRWENINAYWLSNTAVVVGSRWYCWNFMIWLKNLKIVACNVLFHVSDTTFGHRYTKTAIKLWPVLLILRLEFLDKTGIINIVTIGLLISYKSHLEYVINDQQGSATFFDKPGFIQSISAPFIIRAVRGRSKEKLYKELEFEYLSSKRWFRRLSIYKNVKN